MSGYRYPVKSLRDCRDTTLIPPDFSALFFGISGETVPGNSWRLRRIHGAESPRRVGASWETSVPLWKRGNWTQTCKKYFCGFCLISSPFSVTHARFTIKEIQEWAKFGAGFVLPFARRFVSPKQKRPNLVSRVRDSESWLNVYRKNPQIRTCFFPS